MMADKKGGLFGIKMPSMPFGGDKKAVAKADAAAKKPKAAMNQFQANASTAAKKVAEAPKKAAAAVPKVAEKVEESYMALQPGDAGYVDPKVAAAKAASSAKSVASAAKGAAKDAGAAVKAATPTDVKKAAGKAADAVEDAVDTAVKVAKQPGKRGAALLREDFLKSAPERIGVGRQDMTELAPPTYGEPGYVWRFWQGGLNLRARVGPGSCERGWARRGSVDGYRFGRSRACSGFSLRGRETTLWRCEGHAGQCSVRSLARVVPRRGGDSPSFRREMQVPQDRFLLACDLHFHAD